MGPLSSDSANWEQGTESNRRPGGYEPPDLPLIYPAVKIGATRAVSLIDQRGRPVQST